MMKFDEAEIEGDWTDMRQFCNFFENCLIYNFGLLYVILFNAIP
jgi:hypothetical protein